MNEPMTLIEQLKNPAWEAEPGQPARLNIEQTRKTMDKAAEALAQIILESQEEERLKTQNACLRAALELYACPGRGLGCPERQLKDGTCIRAASGGLCGDDAHTALTASVRVETGDQK